MKSFDDWYFELFESGNGSSLNQQEIAEEAWDFRQAEVDELRKRIDEALKLLNIAYPESWAYCVDEAINILKGENHES